MDRETLRRTLANLVKRVTGQCPDDLQDNDILLQKIKLDSFSFVSLVLELEEKLDISLPDAEVQSLTTVGSLLDLISTKVNKTSVPAASAPTILPGPRPAALCASLRTFGYVDVPLTELEALREGLAAAASGPSAQSVVRLCDEQTVLGVAAVADAMRRGGMHADETSLWSVQASSRFLGRRTSVSVYHRFVRVGPGRMTPLLIPFVSLHAGACVVSVYFGCHGPTYGVSGCADNVSEGLLAGLTGALSKEYPGAWVVFTGWEPEPVCNVKGETETPSRGYGVALGLTEWNAQSAMQLVYEAPSEFTRGDMLSMRQLVESVARLGTASCKIPLSSGGAVRIERLAQTQRAAA